MIARCGACRWWIPPDATAPKPVGFCRQDRAPRHQGASCTKFAVTPASAARMIGLCADELAWLQAHASEPITTQLRAALLDYAARPMDRAVSDAAYALIEAWRAEPAHPVGSS